MRKKIAVLMSVVLSGSILMSGCGQTEGEGSVKKEDATKEKVVFAYWGAETENAAITKVIENFEKNNQDIDIEPQWIQKDYLTKVQVQIAGDTMADVYLVSGGDLPGFADNFETMEVDSSKYLSQNLLDAMTVDGEVKAKPFIVKPKVMAINKDLFEKNNLEVPDLETAMTTDEFMEMAAAITDQESAPQIFGSDPLYMGNWLYSFGGSYYKNEGTESNLDSPEDIAAANFMIEMKEKGYVPDDNQKQGQSMMDWFLAGRIGMYTDFGPWYIPQMKDVTGFDWDLVPIPGNGGGKEVDGLAVSNRSEHKEAAQKFVDYLCENEEAQKIIGGDENAYGVPVNSVAVESFEKIYEGKNLGAFVKAAYDQTPQESQKKTNEIGAVQKPLEDETPLGTGTRAPEEVFPEVAEEVTKILQG